MRTAALVYPHQLFAYHPAVAGSDLTVLVEDPLFFRQYRFHRQKLILHRASMKRFAATLRETGLRVEYLDAAALLETGAVAGHLVRWKVHTVRVVEPNDDWLKTRLTAALLGHGIRMEVLDDPDFLTPKAAIEQYAASETKLFFTDFYVTQRKRLGILLDRGKPIGGKWSFDPQNRKKLPKTVRVPPVPRPAENEFIREARQYVRMSFPDALGEDDPFQYPCDRAGAEAWLSEFVTHRLNSFGDFEDAMSLEHDAVFHSLLTPMLNVGLISPQHVIDSVLARTDSVPLNSLEGFVRQVIGWREFVRLVYHTRGRRQRTRNFWNFARELPAAFYDGTTGIDPVDHVIRRVLRSGYCHHIERLMILGNFMLLCEVHPDAVYRWFMELFVDAYDWVMVPNVYGMSQYADGGLMTTKPYVSGSSYVLRMSDFKKGPWCATWDALYWRFIDIHAELFAANPRMALLVKMRDRLGKKLIEHRRIAEEFINKLYS